MTNDNRPSMGSLAVLAAAMMTAVVFFTVASQSVILPHDQLIAMSEQPTVDTPRDEWDVRGLDLNLAAWTVLYTQESGVEHGFYFCGDGETGPVLVGEEHRIPNASRLVGKCDGYGGIFHTHPANGTRAAIPSVGDIAVMRGTDIDVICAASLTGEVGCYDTEGRWMVRDVVD